MTQCLGKNKLQHILDCEVCQDRINLTRQGMKISKAIRITKEQKEVIK